MAGGPARAGRSQRAFLQLVHATLRRHGPGLVSSVPIRYDRCPAPHPMYKVRRPLHRTHPSSAPSHFILPTRAAASAASHGLHRRIRTLLREARQGTRRIHCCVTLSDPRATLRVAFYPRGKVLVATSCDLYALCSYTAL
jgi:hypothetical protein